MPVAVVDVDLTVVDMAPLWHEWLEGMTKVGFTYNQIKNWYDFTIPYRPIWDNKGIAGCPFDFWRNRHLYDGVKPRPGCVDALRALWNKGYEIVFVSAIKGDHHKSKYNMLKEHFPFMSGFIATQEKGYVKADLVIDDRNKFLNMFPDREVIKIRADTPHEQDCLLSVNLDYTFYEWEAFEKWVENYL